MDRRRVVGAMLATATLPGMTRGGPFSEIGEVKARLVEWYRAFANPKVDRAHYLSFTTDDYLLCENGELLDKAGDVALLDSMPADLQRTDSFDFRQVRVEGDNKATLVYFLESQMTDSKNGSRHRRWLESAVLKRNAGVWQFQLLHSTLIESPR